MLVLLNFMKNQVKMQSVYNIEKFQLFKSWFLRILEILSVLLVKNTV